MIEIEFKRQRQSVVVDSGKASQFKIFGAIGLVAVVLIGAAYLVYRKSAASERQAIGVQFVEPANRMVTEQGFSVSGISTGWTASDHVWFATLADPRGDDDTYQPSNHACSVDEFGRWSCGTVFVGGAKDAGKSFEVVLLLMDDDAIANFKAYDDKNPAAHGYPGLPDLPQGARRIASIQVRRI